MTSPKPKVRKVAWVVLGVVLAALGVLLPVLYDSLWLEVPLSGFDSSLPFLGFREYENRFTGSRRVILEDANGETVLSLPPASIRSFEIRLHVQGPGTDPASGRWKRIHLTLADGSVHEAVFEVHQ